MTLMTQKRPTYYMPSEKLAYARGFRHGVAGAISAPRSNPVAYLIGYRDGTDSRSDERLDVASS